MTTEELEAELERLAVENKWLKTENRGLSRRLRMYRSVQGYPEPGREVAALMVFPAPRGGQRPENKHPREWGAILKAAGIKRRVRWHDLRHTCATSLIAGWWGRKWSLEEVRKMLGHSSIRVTERYAHLLDDSVRLAVEETEFPESSLLSGQRAEEVMEIIERRGPDSNRRITVLQTGPKPSKNNRLVSLKFHPGNNYDDDATETEAALREHALDAEFRARRSL